MDALFGPLPKDLRVTPRNPAATAPPPLSSLGRGDWVQILKRVWAGIGEDRVTAVAGGVTFFALLALFPAITALVSIYGLFASPAGIEQDLEKLSRLLPQDAIRIISDQIVSITSAPSSALSFATVLGILLALYSATGGIKAIIGALNVAGYRTEGRNFLWLNLQALAFTLGGIILVIGLIFLIAVIPVILGFLRLGELGAWLIWAGRWPLALAVLVAVLAALYRWGPSPDDRPFHPVLPGAIVAAIGLVAASMLFSWYAANFAGYNKTYGALGAVIALMMWLWIAAIVVMVGAELNSAIEKQLGGGDSGRPLNKVGRDDSAP
ncbi:YihY/virulence factor BrkB family protein [Paracoccus pacificus]|uniref:YihY/virulence factor BrkB family protein n=1 Tax=Paracoccus pacificus TaxID=1463598 RepID=A0ABW4R842_9RHOB